MAPKVIRRPAIGPRRPGLLRRPAALDHGDRGEIPALREDLNVGDLIHGEEATYFGTPCQFSGKVIEEWKDLSGKYYMVKLFGTDLEALLTWASGTTGYARVHKCMPDCGRDAEGHYGRRRVYAFWRIFENSLGEMSSSVQGDAKGTN